MTNPLEALKEAENGFRAMADLLNYMQSGDDSTLERLAAEGKPALDTMAQSAADWIKTQDIGAFKMAMKWGYETLQKHLFPPSAPV